MEMVEFDQRRADEWQAFVARHLRGGFSYTIAFRDLVTEIYRLRSRYLMFYRQEQLVGVLPLFIQNRRSLISVPFCEYGGFLGETEHIAPMAELVKSSYSAKNLEIRFNNGAAVPGFKSTPMGEAASLPLSGVDDGYLKRVDHSVRKNLKTARHHGVEIEVTATPSAYLDSYFEMSRHHFTRHHGSPYMPRAFYKGLFSSDHAALAIARQQGTIIGFLMAWHNQRHIQIVEIIGNKDCWHTRFNDLLHFEMIQWAKRSGFDLFDFGSVRYEGQRRYKRKWGVSFTPFTISYLGHLNHMDPDAHWAKMARGIWRHLPLRLTDRLTWYARRLTLQ